MAQDQGNAVDQAQAKLDAQQNGEAPVVQQAPTYATAADIKSIVDAAVRGQQGQIDKGLTALRRDFNQQLESQKADAAIESLPEETRVLMAPLIERMRGLEQRLTQAPAADVAAPAADTDLDTFLAGMGLNAQTIGLDLAAYSRGDMPAFLASTASVLRGVPNEAPQTAATPTPQTMSPPVDGAPAGGGGSGNVWDTYDLYNSGQITLEDFQQRTATADAAELNR